MSLKMSDNNNNGDGEINRKTDSNLPILFANGYPTSLDKMTCEQLERFIPFLVKCSQNGKVEEIKPNWWPNVEVDYKVPFEKPKNFRKNWLDILREIVESCYDFHNQPFLLKYSSSLSENDPANLRYAQASETTTSLFSRNPKKLLLTFRNENMLYDKKKRMTLWKKDEAPSLASEQEEVESTFDIILCDCCDAEFYSDEAYQKHEKVCGNIAEQETPVIENIVISDDEEDIEESNDIINEQHNFLAHFSLVSSTADELPRRNNSMVERSLSPKKKRTAQRTRKVISKKEKDLEMAIPFSSPAGMVLTKKTVSLDYVQECLAEIEAYCIAKPTIRIVPRVYQRFTGPESNVVKEMRKPRLYFWPKRHLHSKSREDNFRFLNRSVMDQMSQCSVVVNQLSETDIRAIQENLAVARMQKKRSETEKCVDLCSDSDNESVLLSDGVTMESFEHESEFFTMQSSIMLPSKSLLSLEEQLSSVDSAALPISSEVVLYNRSQLFNQMFSQTTSFTSATTTTTSIVSRRKRSSTDSASPTRSTKHSIKQWIQNVNVENFTNVVKTN